METQESNKKRCISYAPGHNVHWIQARVKYAEPRHDAKVEVLSDTKLMVSYLNQVKIFQHHKAWTIQENLLKGVLGYVKFSPTASLLYIQTEGPNGIHKGAFALHYLSDSGLSDCVFYSFDD
jgi:hypothetical protein